MLLEVGDKGVEDSLIVGVLSDFVTLCRILDLKCEEGAEIQKYMIKLKDQ